MKFSKSVLVCLGLVSMAALVFTPSVFAQTRQFNLDTLIITHEAGPATTVATLTLTQNGSDVNFDLFKVPGISEFGNDSFLSEINFPYQGPLSQDALTSALQNIGTQEISAFGVSATRLDSGYHFAVQVLFPTAGGGSSLLDGEHALWTAKGSSVDDFVEREESIEGWPAAYALTHVQIAGTTSDFTYVAVVPEAETWLMMMVGLGLVGWVVTRHSGMELKLAKEAS